MKKQSVNPKNVIVILFLLFAIFSVINTVLLSNLNKEIIRKIELSIEKLKPAKLEVAIITFSECDNCYDIKNTLEDLKKQNVNITKEESFDSNSIEGKQLINQYKIEKIPTLIITGETNKTDQLQRYWNVIGEKRGNSNETIIYTKITPPFYDLKEKRITGRVSIINLVDLSCGKCVSLIGIVNGFKKEGVAVKEERIVEYKSAEGKELIAKFGIKKIPALIVSRDILDYDRIRQIWNQLNATEKDGLFALHPTIPPYIDVSTDNVVGLVTIVTLEDKTCDTCYNVSINKLIIKRFGVFIDKEFSYDVDSVEGKKLISEYNITEVPIIIVSPEASVYASFTSVWSQVGNTADDGWYIMRRPEVLGTYKDLVTNKIIEAKQE